MILTSVKLQAFLSLCDLTFRSAALYMLKKVVQLIPLLQEKEMSLFDSLEAD